MTLGKVYMVAQIYKKCVSQILKIHETQILNTQNLVKLHRRENILVYVIKLSVKFK